MSGSRPHHVIDPVCGMTVETASAEAAGLTIEHEGRTYAFCRPGCRRAFTDEPEVYARKADLVHVEPISVVGTPPIIDAGMRLWYEKCSCCLSDAFPEVKAALDAERAGAAVPPVDPGICEVAESQEAVTPR